MLSMNSTLTNFDFLSHLPGNSEEHTALSRALSQLAEVEEKIEQLHLEQVWIYLLSQTYICSYGICIREFMIVPLYLSVVLFISVLNLDEQCKLMYFCV